VKIRVIRVQARVVLPIALKKSILVRFVQPKQKFIKFSFMKKPILLLILVLNLVSTLIISQNENAKWYFGANAGLDFMTTPPTVLTNGMMNTSEGCAAMSDAAGNLMFYTDGLTIWDKNHAIMSNGTGLTGNSSTTQSAMIIKHPGNPNKYLVFSLGVSGTGSLSVSEVDMTLAAGLGSVTVLNTFLHAPSSEKLTAVQHCNKKDFWVMSHGGNDSVFYAWKVTAAGVNLTPVTNTIGSSYSGTRWCGNMKFSPNGSKLAVALYGTPGGFEMFDFNNVTGQLSNHLMLSQEASFYGTEFSPDGSKLYGSRQVATNGLYQWDLCAGSNAAILASQFTVTTPGTVWGMQFASDGKIYGARIGDDSLAIIHNPNALGAACNLQFNGISVGPKTSQFNLPSFITSGFSAPPQPSTYTVSNCTTVTFSAQATGTVVTNCSAMGTTYRKWIFGDPMKAPGDTSSLAVVSHTYSAAGTYTVKLINHNNCSQDTTIHIVTIGSLIPTLGISGPSSACKGDVTKLTVSGAHTYIWSRPGVGLTTSPSFTTVANATVVYTVTGTNTLGGCSSTRVYTVTVNECTGMEEISGTQVTFFPNPGNGHFTFEAPAAIHIRVISQLGSIVLEKELPAGRRQLDLTHLPGGIYYLQSIGENRTGTRVLMINATN
jgi:PKD repeat protein